MTNNRYMTQKMTHTIQRSKNYSSDVLFTLIFPTFNESENVKPLMAELSKHMEKSPYSYEVLFIDDSNDDTPFVIAQCMDLYDNVAMLHRAPADRKKGLSSAFVEGFERAQGEYIICMDSDLQHPPEAVPRMMEQAMKAKTDIVGASRYRAGGHADGLLTPYRKAVSHFCRFFAWTFLPATQKSTDPGSGMFALEASLAKSIDGSKLRGFKILIEILAQKREATVSEISYGFRKRENNDSKATMKQGINYIVQVIDLWKVYYLKPFTQSLFGKKTPVVSGIFISVVCGSIAAIALA